MGFEGVFIENFLKPHFWTGEYWQEGVFTVNTPYILIPIQNKIPVEKKSRSKNKIRKSKKKRDHVLSTRPSFSPHETPAKACGPLLFSSQSKKNNGADNENKLWKLYC